MHGVIPVWLCDVRRNVFFFAFGVGMLTSKDLVPVGWVGGWWGRGM